MKIIWITNSPFPEVAAQLNSKGPFGVGWVHSAANALVRQFKDIELAVASIYNGKEMKQVEMHGIAHYLLPEIVRKKANDPITGSFWLQIKEQFKPDIIHIHGAEYPQSYSYVKACGAENVVVSIQGLVSVYERYYYGNIEMLDILKSITLRDVVQLDTIVSKRRNMFILGKNEKLLLQEVKHVIGRTSWDRDHVWAINPNAHYHFCNETLRSSFFENQWSLNSCEKYSVFVSQAYYPIKGFHQLIKALPTILRHYPETKVYVAGKNYFSNRGIRISGYGRYINSLIKKYKLSKQIIFTGSLTEKNMCQRFLSSHLFISPSAIENSPNSVGEAQILGVPCISSYVGGIGDMIEHGETGLLYRFEEVEMLAANVCKLFSDDEFAQHLSMKGRICAAKRHNKEENSSTLYKIYSDILHA